MSTALLALLRRARFPVSTNSRWPAPRQRCSRKAQKSAQPGVFCERCLSSNYARFEAARLAPNLFIKLRFHLCWHKPLEARPDFGHNAIATGAVAHFAGVSPPHSLGGSSGLPLRFYHEYLANFFDCCGDRGSRARSRLRFEIAPE